jgi:hypothetical protein
MTQQFHEGQEVEVLKLEPEEGHPGVMRGWWRDAKIVHPQPGTPILDPGYYVVQFRDGTRAVFDAVHIRAISPLDERFSRAPTTEAEHQTMLAGDSAEEYPGLAEPDDDTSNPMSDEATP